MNTVDVSGNSRFTTSAPFRWIIIFPILLYCCSSLTPTGNKEPADYHYLITLTGLHEDSLTFSLSIQKPVSLTLPCHFFDNPLYTVSDDVIRDLLIIDADGSMLDTLCRLEKIGPVQNKVIELPQTASYPVTVTYKLNTAAYFSDSTTRLPPIQINDSLMYLIGSTCFVLPYSPGSLVEFWRSPVQYSLEVQSKIPVFGIPSSSFSCATTYELLFIQMISGKQPVAKSYAAGMEVSFFNFSNIDCSSDDYLTVSTHFSGIMDVLSQKFGSFRGDTYTICFNMKGGGLEGSFGFTMLPPNTSTTNGFYEVLVHEALHNFIGIRCGDYDDPWWKEATATYLGMVIAVRQGLYVKESFREKITKEVYFADSSRFRIPLSDPWLRENMFPENVHALVYDLGAKVTMLLDLQIRIASENRYSIDDVTAYLTRHFDNAAFHRHDLLAAFQLHGNADISEIFSLYIDSTGTVPSEELLQQTYFKLDSLHAFQ